MQPRQKTVLTDFTLIRRAVFWLLLLVPLFYASYAFANWLASQRAFVPEIVFGWEKYIPFWGWTIIPYWSLNLFYGVALLVSPSKQSQNRLAGRYLTAQCIAILCFVAFPLTITWEKPETPGFSGWLFSLLGNFDLPYNQAPSLHIALTVIIWDHLRRLLPAQWRPLWHGWCLLIGFSVLTTWQHHFIDIPTGMLLGLFALWLFPLNNTAPWLEFQLTRDRRSQKLTLIYAAGGIALLLTILASKKLLWLLLLWPSLALLLLSFGYSGAGAKIFQKNKNGGVSLASYWLFMPLRPFLWLNRLLWTWREPAAIEISDGVYLGRFPTRAEAAAYATVIDMTGEVIAPKNIATQWQSFPSLDLASPDPVHVQNAVLALEQAQRPVLVCCALGFQRSANVAAQWLVTNGYASDRKQAIELLRKSGRPVHLTA